MTNQSECALQMEHEEPLRIMALHALAYCPRLFYLEEVEEIRIADDRVYAGRALHEIVAPDDFDGKLMTQIELTGDKIGLTGKIDCLCRRNGFLIPYEHKRGRSQLVNGKHQAWTSDALQVSAYGLLLEEVRNMNITEGRVRYHADNQTVKVPLDDQMRQTVVDMIAEGRRLRLSTERPPVTPHEKRCVRCSLASVCLPEEERLAKDPDHKTIRLFPENRQRSTIHVISAGSRVSKTGEAFLLTSPEGLKKQYPCTDVDGFVIDGFSQITTQALQLCSANDISVHWLNSSGSYMGSFAAGTGPVQRRIRQYEALGNESVRLRLTRLLVQSKVEQTLRYILRCTRGEADNGKVRPDKEVRMAVNQIRCIIQDLNKSEDIDAIRGYEGLAAKEYFGIMNYLLKENIPDDMRPKGRSRRPPKDRFNAILSYLYTLLYTTVLQSVLIVGLEPAFGFYHTPRSSTPPLVLDLMELFRLIVCDIPLIGSINRLQWDVTEDFDINHDKVWLSRSGKKKTVELYERRLQDKWKHSVIGYSLSYARLIELEIRLLEKEWTGEEGLFAKFRIR